MTTYRTAQGKTVDMAALAAKNENVRAIGNMKVNARGDTIDAHGKVIVPATELASARYAGTVGNKSAQIRGGNLTPDVAPAPMELTESEKELEDSLSDDVAVEEIKAAETKKGKK